MLKIRHIAKPNNVSGKSDRRISMEKRQKILTVSIILLTFLICNSYAQDLSNSHILWTIDWNQNDKFIAVGGNLDTLRIYFSKKTAL